MFAIMALNSAICISRLPAMYCTDSGPNGLQEVSAFIFFQLSWYDFVDITLDAGVACRTAVSIVSIFNWALNCVVGAITLCNGPEPVDGYVDYLNIPVRSLRIVVGLGQNFDRSLA
jgi:hypothetical protein